jgi:hypothetical protein
LRFCIVNSPGAEAATIFPEGHDTFSWYELRVMNGNAKWAVVATCLSLSGCILNSVHPVHRPQTIETGKAIVVIGLGAPVAGPFPKFGVVLDEYSLKAHQITGNCFFYNRIEAAISSPHEGIAYFAFEVPAGIYVFGSTLRGQVQPAAFVAEDRKAVYFGDFVAVGNKTIELHYDISAARSATAKLLPRLELTQAESRPDIVHGPGLLCTP